MMTAKQAAKVYQQAECLHCASTVDQALDRMAVEITQQLSDSIPVVLCVMTGGIVPTGQLLPRLDFPLELDYLHATRYREETKGRDIKWLGRHRTSLQDRTVLVIDDILDEGITLGAIVDHCYQEGAWKVYSAVLVDKQHSRKWGLKQADFCGLYVEDRYVFGYGMDYKGYLRNAPGIYAVGVSNHK